MERRHFLALAGTTLIAGCGAQSESGGEPTTESTTANSPTQTSTPTPTPEPPSFEITSTSGGVYTVGEPWVVEFTVANRGEQDGTFTSMLQFRTGGSEWINGTEISVHVPGGEATTYTTQELGEFEEPGSFTLRLKDTDAQWTITFERDESNFEGPTTENREYVELQYRDYLDHEVEAIRRNAQNIDYRTMFRDIEKYIGTPINYTGTIIQTLSVDTHYIFLIAIDNSSNKLVNASWTGDRYIEGDEIEFWGVVLGTEVYQTGSGSQNTIPALSIADIELQN